MNGTMNEGATASDCQDIAEGLWLRLLLLQAQWAEAAQRGDENETRRLWAAMTGAGLLMVAIPARTEVHLCRKSVFAGLVEGSSDPALAQAVRMVDAVLSWELETFERTA